MILPALSINLSAVGTAKQKYSDPYVIYTTTQEEIGIFLQSQLSCSFWQRAALSNSVIKLCFCIRFEILTVVTMKSTIFWIPPLWRAALPANFMVKSKESKPSNEESSLLGCGTV
jgi:hypothetical protein